MVWEGGRDIMCSILHRSTDAITKRSARRKKQKAAPPRYVIPGFEERWRSEFTEERFRELGVGDDSEELRRVMAMSEVMLEELPTRLAQFLKRGEEEDERDGEDTSGTTISRAKRMSLSNTPIVQNDIVTSPLSWDETRTVLDDLLGEKEELLLRECSIPSSHHVGFIPCAMQEGEC